MIQAGIIQGVSGLARVKFHQPRLTVAGSMGLAEERYHHAESFTTGIDDGRAEHRAEADVCGRIDKGEICSGPIDVLNQYAAVRREEGRGQVTERLDLLRGEAGKRRNLKRLAGTFRQKQEHAEVGFLQRSD